MFWKLFQNIKIGTWFEVTEIEIKLNNGFLMLSNLINNLVCLKTLQWAGTDTSIEGFLDLRFSFEWIFLHLKWWQFVFKNLELINLMNIMTF